MAGFVFDETSTPVETEPEEIIYAVAYIDVVADDGGYDPAIDHLIARLVEASGDGSIGEGDKVITDKYPTTFESAYAEFNTTVHTITYCDNITASEINCIYDSFQSAQFIFKHREEIESYTEGDFDSPSNYSLIVDDMAGSIERIQLAEGSPSNPSPSSILTRDDLTGDDAFIDVEIRLPD